MMPGPKEMPCKYLTHFKTIRFLYILKSQAKLKNVSYLRHFT